MRSFVTWSVKLLPLFFLRIWENALSVIPAIFATSGK